MSDAPDKVWAWSGYDSCGAYGHWYKDGTGGGDTYLLSTPAREAAEELVEVLRKWEDLSLRHANEYAMRMDANRRADFHQGIREAKDILARYQKQRRREMGDSTDGGPAFPLQTMGPDFLPGHHGMTLRDYFAGQVLASMFSRGCPKEVDSEYLRQHGAKHVYAVADAMLEARKQPTPLKDTDV